MNTVGLDLGLSENFELVDCDSIILKNKHMSRRLYGLLLTCRENKRGLAQHI
jgi:hypothetical protein